MQVVKNLKPKHVARLIEKGAKLGYMINGVVTPAGVAQEATVSGKTIWTDGGFVFKWRGASNRFALRGNQESDIHVYGKKTSKRAPKHVN